jgi:hypothetical protein
MKPLDACGENTGHVEVRFVFCAWQNAAEIILLGPLSRPTL